MLAAGLRRITFNVPTPRDSGDRSRNSFGSCTKHPTH
jgi:hypothetical protein